MFSSHTNDTLSRPSFSLNIAELQIFLCSWAVIVLCSDPIVSNAVNLFFFSAQLLQQNTVYVYVLTFVNLCYMHVFTFPMVYNKY